MHCLRCQHENPPNTKFCGECAGMFIPRSSERIACQLFGKRRQLY